MVHLKLHTFACLIIVNKITKKRTLQPDFTKAETDMSKRHYDFGIDLDTPCFFSGVDNGKTFREVYTTRTKLKELQDPNGHRKDANEEVWHYCPKCITKIAKELGL